MPAFHENAPRAPRDTAYLAQMPILILNAHNRCNCRCIMCDIWQRKTLSEIGAADLEVHRASLRKLGVRHVVLTGGEPLLHSDLDSLCRFFHQENVRLTLLTTGLLLLKRAEDVAALFSDVVLSIDGPEEIHNAIRRVKGAFRLIHDGVVAVRQLRPNMPITGRCTLQKANHRSVRATVAAAKSLGLDSISFLAADLTSEAFNRPLPWPVERQNDIGLTNEEVRGLEEEIEQLIALHAKDIRSGYIVESAVKLRMLVRRYRGRLGQVEHESPPCNAPWVSAVIETDGTVRPCFFHKAIGNINRSTLEDTINGSIAQEFRQSLNVAENPTCRRCVCSLDLKLSESR